MRVSPAISQVYIGKEEIKNGITLRIGLEIIYVYLFHRESVLVKIDRHIFLLLS